MTDFIAAAKALSDPNRVRALMALRRGELCLCQIIELLAIAPSTASKHMSILKSAGLVESRKEEKWIYYRLTENSSLKGIDNLIKVCIDMVSSDSMITNDQVALKKISNVSSDEICRKYKK